MSRRTASLFGLIIITLVMSLIFTPGDSAQAQVQVLTGSWQANFYNNTSFSGTPVFNRIYSSEELRFLDWRLASPSPNVPTDNFSAIFTSTQFLQPGNYRFAIFVDDQAELRVNGQLLIDINQPGSETVEYNVPFAGNYNFEIRYIELTSTAFMQFQATTTTTGVIGGATFTPVPTAVPTRTPLPPIPQGALTATVIRASVLNVRNAPSLGGGVIGRILRGETYAVVGRDEDARWFLLQLGGFQGWSFGFYLFIDGNEFNAPIVSGASLLGLAGQQDFGVRGQTDATLRLREGPSVATRQIGRVTWGAFLPLIGRTRDGFWYQTVWKGTVGWVYSPFVEIVEGDINNVPIK